MRHQLAFAIVLMCVSSSLAQTSSDFETKYGKPVKSYLVSENIWMTPEYTTDGQVCVMRLHPRRFATNTNYVSPNLPFQELNSVLNQLVPLHTRGAKKDAFDTGATGGQMEWRTYSYEHVQFSFLSPFNVEPDSWKARKEYVFSIEAAPTQPLPKHSAPSEKDFSSSQASRIEIVTIKWKGRQCRKEE